MATTNDQLDRLVSKAAEEQIAGRVEAAEHLCQQALGIDPDCVPAKFILGVLLARKGDDSQAISLLDDVIVAEPRSFEALMSLSSLCVKAGDTTRAAALANRAVEVRPADARAHYHFGNCLLASRRLREAAREFRRAIALEPRLARAYHKLGRILQLEGKPGDAVGAFEQAAKLSPTPVFLLDLGKTHLLLSNIDRAEKCARASLSLDPNSAAAHLLLCGALIERNLDEEAAHHLHIATELDKSGAEALLLSQMQRRFGLVEEANGSLERAIDTQPQSVWAYKALIYNRRVTEKDTPLVERLKLFLEDGGLSATERVSVHYGLGKALEDLGDYELSMRHYDEANRMTRSLKLSDSPFYQAKYEASMDRLIEDFTPSGSPERSNSDLPIVILGMMRSGTTLAEQILSSHPDVQAGGEQTFWTRNCSRALGPNAESPARLAEEYLQTLKAIGPQSRRVTDKMPGNYRFAGLIHNALPNAHIIHMRRSPVDTCLSIWATTNELPNEGGHDKGDIVFVYKQYLRLMEHWRKVLPAERFLEVDYEDLVTNREEVTRRMLTFCELEWSDLCLHPEANDRIVVTPSLDQVRRPVYNTSIGRGLRFEPWLGEFSSLLPLKHP